jgi:O-antigen ligase
MTVYILVGAASGFLFAILDGVINANPFARRLFEVYKPIARTYFNPLAGILIDLLFGFVMAGVFLLLYASLPGETGLVKGISFAILTWFFRVVMSAASQWVMFNVPAKTTLYSLISGLGEMLVLGGLYGLTLKPTV